ncbi:hypothetical protein [Streptomyces sp. NPDC046685]|uniref:hypothetical protein n=1 Tax=Streptomyces sp. NPDC046685 TaxID=3157202 RepID=UPI0033E7D0E6
MPGRSLVQPGSGIIGHGPQRPVSPLVELGQFVLLQDAAAFVRPGGHVVVVTRSRGDHEGRRRQLDGPP